MKIEFVNQYGVISNFTATELPDFAVLIGPNGAGKSHIFRALINYGLDQDAPSSLVIHGIAKEEILYFDPNSFRSHSSRQANRQTSEQVRGLTDAFFLHRPEGGTLRDLSAKVFDEVVDAAGDSREAFVAGLTDEIYHIPRQGIFGLKVSSEYVNRIRNLVLSPLSEYEQQHSAASRGSRNANASVENSQYCRLLSVAMRKTNKFLHELTREDIAEALHYDEHLLSNRLSEIFSAYKRLQEEWAEQQFRAGESMSHDELIQQYQKNSPPPWTIMREVLADMREAAGNYALFDFDFTDPNDLELSMANFDVFAFTAEMINRTTGASYNLDNLSSGEQILMALCMVSFNQIVGMHPPQLLLLDEIDAMLHPSMVKALVRTLKTLFVSSGIPVLMTSHSPMTVATLDDGEVFRVGRMGYQVEISPVSKADAISELSEGLATVDKGLRIAAYDEAKITILTEGNNTKHLKKWAELHFPEDVRVFEGLEAYSGDTQLLMYGRFLARVDTNTHFVVVWDCDAAGKAEDLRRELHENAKVTAYAFPKRANSIARNGIENIYDEDVLEHFTAEVRRYGGTVNKLEFDGNRKTEFADFILENGTLGHFTHFEDLNEVINEILQGMATGYESGKMFGLG